MRHLCLHQSDSIKLRRQRHCGCGVTAAVVKRAPVAEHVGSLAASLLPLRVAILLSWPLTEAHCTLLSMLVSHPHPFKDAASGFLSAKAACLSPALHAAARAVSILVLTAASHCVVPGMRIACSRHCRSASGQQKHFNSIISSVHQQRQLEAALHIPLRRLLFRAAASAAPLIRPLTSCIAT
jgi:hypothetical protein